MVTLRLSVDDLAQTRFAISPMFELASSLRALRDPARAALHVPWIREALPIATRLDLAGAIALTPPEGYMPDFLTPPPSSPLATIEEELELVQATSEQIIREDLLTLARWGEGDADRLDPFLADPIIEVGRVIDALREFWKQALLAHWPRIRQLLQDDIRYRARRLTEGGPSRLFEDLDERVRWRGDRIEVDIAFSQEIELGGRGLLLVPSAFQATRPAMITDPPWQPTLVYPARGVGLLWEPRRAGDGRGDPEADRRLAGAAARRTGRTEIDDRPRDHARDDRRRRLAASDRPARERVGLRGAGGTVGALSANPARRTSARGPELVLNPDDLQRIYLLRFLLYTNEEAP